MSAHLRRKVDQQLEFSHDLLGIEVEPEARNALASALCWQLEQTLCFYLLELGRAGGNRRWSHGWTLDADLLMAALKAVPSTDLQELVDLSLAPDSWLTGLLSGLGSLRRVDESPALKGELFQSDLEVSKPVLIASSSAVFPSVPNWEDLAQITEAMRQLIQRQRLGHEEY